MLELIRKKWQDQRDVKFVNGLVTSIKTIDLTSETYGTGRSIASVLKIYISKIKFV